MNIRKLYASNKAPSAFVLVISCFLSGCMMSSTVSDWEYTPSAVLCERLLNTPAMNVHRKSREKALAKRGEDCSRFTNLKEITVNIN